MADTKKEEKKHRGYREEENFKPSPFDQVGSVSTNGLGDHFSHIERISPVFSDAFENSKNLAKRALDPDDETVLASQVVLPTGATIVHSDPEAARERVLALTADDVDDTADDDEDDDSTENPYDSSVDPFVSEDAPA